MTTTNVPLRRAIPCLKRKLAAGMTEEQAQREYEERRAEGRSHDEITRLDQMKWSPPLDELDAIAAQAFERAREPGLPEEQRAAAKAEANRAVQHLRTESNAARNRAAEAAAERERKAGLTEAQRAMFAAMRDTEAALSRVHENVDQAARAAQRARKPGLTLEQRAAAWTEAQGAINVLRNVSHAARNRAQEAAAGWAREVTKTEEERAALEAAQAAERDAETALANARKAYEQAAWAYERAGTDTTEEERAALAAAQAAKDIAYEACQRAREATIEADTTERERAIARVTTVAQAAAYQCDQCRDYFDDEASRDEGHRVWNDRWRGYDGCLDQEEMTRAGWRLIYGVWHAPLNGSEGGRAS
jgi:hypothetical protein